MTSLFDFIYCNKGGFKREPLVPFSLCFYTSLLFYTNHITAVLKGKIEYAYSFYLLTVTSLVVHGIYDCTITNLIDKVAIFQVVTMGGYYFIKNINTTSTPRIIAIVSTFALVSFIYFYGYLKNCMCFGEDIDQRRWCHAVIHLLSSIGHHLITEIV
jgi:hypothetical protein